MSTLSTSVNTGQLTNPPIRPEYEIDLKPFNTMDDGKDSVLEKQLPFLVRLWHINGLRKIAILLSLALCWELLCQMDK
ncbi:hypothetical protein OURE66S_04630 [Oligella ureolytica]